MQNLDNTRSLLVKIDHETDDLSFPTDETYRNSIAAALFDIVLEHSRAIVVLLDKNFQTSALALMRPLFECFIQAEWILCCATVDEIKQFIRKDKLENYMGDMLTAVEEKKDWPDTLTRIKNNALNPMHSFTHGGFVPISRRIQEDSIEAIFKNVEIEALLQLTSYLAFLAYNDMIEMSGNAEKHKALNEIFEWLSGWFVPETFDPDQQGG